MKFRPVIYRLNPQPKVVYLYVQVTWIGFAAVPVLYIDAVGSRGGNPGALVRKKNFQVGG